MKVNHFREKIENSFKKSLFRKYAAENISMIVFWSIINSTRIFREKSPDDFLDNFPGRFLKKEYRR